MKLICYMIGEEVPRLQIAPARRDWMDASVDKGAYRCLPLSIANALGWQLLNPRPFVANWDGSASVGGVRVTSPDPTHTPIASSHFGGGVLTFKLHCLFKTESPFQLWVSGPVNQFKDGIQPITGIVETDWLGFTFTMNWMFTRSNLPIAFERDEPFCTIFPISIGAVESVRPELRRIDDDTALASEFRSWDNSRRSFLSELKDPKSDAAVEEWQKHYIRGRSPTGASAPTHRTKVSLRSFETK